MASAQTRLDGGAGNDTMVGGADNDTYVVDAAGDVVTEAAGGGTDTVLSAITYTLGSEVENLTLTGAGNVNATGNTLANVITGNSGNNIIIGGAGNDTIDGGTGIDTITGGAGADSINVNNGNDRLLYTSTLEVGDIVTNFDNAGGTGAQDYIDLDGLFDSLGVAAAARAGRTSLVDTGANVDLRDRCRRQWHVRDHGPDVLGDGEHGRHDHRRGGRRRYPGRHLIGLRLRTEAAALPAAAWRLRRRRGGRRRRRSAPPTPLRQCPPAPDAPMTGRRPDPRPRQCR